MRHATIQKIFDEHYKWLAEMKKERCMSISERDYNTIAWIYNGIALSNIHEDNRPIAIARALSDAYTQGQKDGWLQEQEEPQDEII